MRSDALIEAGDVFIFNGLRGQPAQGAYERYKIVKLDVFGRVHLEWSAGPSDPWSSVGVTVPYTEAMAMVNDNVWELVVP